MIKPQRAADSADVRSARPFDRCPLHRRKPCCSLGPALAWGL